MTETNEIIERQAVLRNLKDRLSDSEGEAVKDPQSLVLLGNDIRAYANQVNMLNVEVITLLQELECKIELRLKRFYYENSSSY